MLIKTSDIFKIKNPIVIPPINAMMLYAPNAALTMQIRKNRTCCTPVIGSSISGPIVPIAFDPCRP